MKSTARIIELTRHSLQREQAVNQIVRDRVLISAAEGTHVIPFREIRRCAADGNYCHIYLTNGEAIITSKTLKHVSTLVPNMRFVRVHQSHLVNRQHIRFIGNDHLLLDDGTRVPVSRAKRDALRKVILSVNR